MARFRRPRSPHDACLLVRAQRDPEAFGLFYRAYVQRVLLFHTRRTLRPDVALDLTAESFAIALERRHDFRGTTREEEQGWLFAVARSQLSRYFRRGDVEREALARIGVAAPAASDAELERIDELAGTARLRAEVRDALDGLPTDQQSAVLLRVLGELEYDEIADRFDVSEDVIRARVSRGLRRMRDRLDEPALPEEQA